MTRPEGAAARARAALQIPPDDEGPESEAAAAYSQHDDNHALLTRRAPCPGGSYHELLVEVGDLRAAARALEGEQG